MASQCENSSYLLTLYLCKLLQFSCHNERKIWIIFVFTTWKGLDYFITMTQYTPGSLWLCLEAFQSLSCHFLWFLNCSYYVFTFFTLINQLHEEKERTYYKTLKNNKVNDRKTLWKWSKVSTFQIFYTYILICLLNLTFTSSTCCSILKL